MAFADLLGSLTRRAETEIAGLLATAQDEAARLRREADRRCADRSAAALRERTRAITADTERAVAEAVRLERQTELTARRRARDRVLAAARAQLALTPDRADYRVSLPARFAAAVAAIGGQPARVRCPPRLTPLLTPLTAGQANLRIEADPALSGGFRIAADDGRVIVDDTLEERLAADGDALGQLALRALGVPA